MEMAVSTLRLTAEEKNYWKFCMLNVRVVPGALRSYFDGLIPPTYLATTINNYSSTILNLVTWKVINAAQLNILQRIPGTIWPSKVTPVPIGSTDTFSAHFDVTLMVCLLRNITLPGISQPVTGWDTLPNPNDICPGAYLARTKYYRNEIAHSTEHTLNTFDFQDKWKALSEAIKFFNGGSHPNDILDIWHCDLDGSHNGDVVTALSTEIDEIKRDLTLVEVENNQIKKDLKRTKLQLEDVRNNFAHYKRNTPPKRNLDRERDALLHAVVAIERQEDSIEFANMLLESAFKHIRVFVTYADDSKKHLQKVLNLCRCLDKNSFSCCLDVFDKRMPQEHMLNRQGWCAHQYNEADFIIMCVSEQYKTEIDMYECESQIDDKELHIQFIYSLMLAELKQNGNKNSRVIPLLFKGCTEVNIPQWLEHTYVYTWPGQYRDLLWCLTKPHTRIKLQSQRNHSTSTSHVNGPHSI